MSAKTKNPPISAAANENRVSFQTGSTRGRYGEVDPVFAHWLKAVDEDQPFRVTFVKMAFESYESRCWPFISEPITGYLFFLVGAIMTLPLSMMSSFRVDLILHGLLSIVWNRTATEVPAQRRTSLCWNASISPGCEVPPENCWSWNK